MIIDPQICHILVYFGFHIANEAFYANDDLMTIEMMKQKQKIVAMRKSVSCLHFLLYITYELKEILL